ncbi:hypothetical protein OQA88_9975 [Cercophora sp. LCS_1]
MLPLILVLVLVLSIFRPTSADQTTTIDAKSNRGTWEGWGTSLAWWAAAFGQRDDLADLFFTNKTNIRFGSTNLNLNLPGLSFNIARYNAGASSSTPVNGSRMAVSPKMIPSRQIQGYWLDWASEDPSSQSWNWNVDSAQRAMLLKAQSRGADILELFSNSPMWWMCVNHNPSGNDDGKKDNLQSWNYRQHAVYLANVARHAESNWGVRFQSVAPFNEPSASWWHSQGTQEGCHFEGPTMRDVVGHLRRELDRGGMGGVMVSVADESYYDEAVKTMSSLAGVMGSVGRVNVHGYQYGDGRRDGLFDAVSKAGKRLWQSEYGEADATGQRMVSNMLLDFRWLRPTAWVYWQVLDGGGWGLVEADNDAKTVGGPNQKYWLLAQFSRHIRPGMRILDGGSDYTVAAYDADARKLVVVAVNWGDQQYLNFDLSRFGNPGTNGAVVKRWATQIGSGGIRYVEYADTTLSGNRFWSRFEKNMVQTFEVAGVVL